MSSGTPSPPLSVPEMPAAPPSQCELAIERRIEQTQRNVKGVDIAYGLIVLVIGVLVYLLAAALIDHWLVVGGLGFWGRFWLWLGLIGAAGAFFSRRLLPPLCRRINPLFAAATIEQSQPSLKNSLINLLLLRNRRREVAPIVYQAMERQAAADLAGVEMEVAVDREHVIRMGYVLVAILAIFALYFVLSKSPLRSAARVLWPWANIEAPTRVTIREIEPGDKVAFLGDSVTVSAEIAGLADGEPAMVVYSTADGQTVDQTVPLTCAEGDYRYQCRLPPDNTGLQQDLVYHLAAGDCRTRSFRIEAQIAPAIVVDKVTYHYPEYTGIADRTVDNQGDVQAIEGAEVTIHATANTEIKPGSAEIDLGCSGRTGQRMTVDGRTAVGRFTLEANPKDGSAEYAEYQIRFTDVQGRENVHPIRHRIDLVRDLPPEVKLVEPQQEEVQLPVDGKLLIKVQAEDPDFALQRVLLRAQCDNKSLPIAPLLDLRKSDKASQRAFSGGYTFEPARLKLKVGDRVKYWAEAEDNKEPTPGHAATAKQRIVIVGAEKQKAASEDGSENKQPGGSEDSNTTEDRSDDAAKDAKGNGQSNEGRSEENANQTTGDQGKPDGKGSQPEQNKPDASKNAPSEPQSGDSSASSPSGQADNRQSAGKSGEQKGKPENGGNAGDSQQLAQNSERPKIDPEAAPGDAIQEILNDRQKEKKTEKAKPSTDAGGAGKSEEQKQDASQGSQNGGNADGEKGKNDGKEGSAGEKGDSKTTESGNRPEGKSPAQRDSSQQNKDAADQGANEDRTEDAAKNKPGRDAKGGADQEKGASSSESKPGDKQADKKGQPDQQPSDKDSAEGKAGSEKSQGGQPGGKDSGDGKAGSDKPQGGQPGGQGKDDAGAGGDSSKAEKGKGGGAADQKNAGAGQTGGDSSDSTKGKGGGTKGQKETGKPDGGESDAGQGSSDQKGDKKDSGKDSSNAAGATEDESGSANGGKEEKADGSESSAQASGDKARGDKKERGDGKNAGGKDSSTPQGAQPSQAKKPGEAGEAQGDRKGEMAQPSGTSQKQSDSSGATAGDHSGQGETGGGLQSNKPGVGGPGSQTDANQGGSASKEPGQGETGSKAGDGTVSKTPTGSRTKAPTGEAGTTEQGSDAEDGAKGDSKTAAGKPVDQKGEPGDAVGQKPVTGDGSSGKATKGDQAGKPPGGEPSGTPEKGPPGGENVGKSSVPTGDGGKPTPGSEAASSEPAEDSADAANLEYSRRQTELALEHLRDQLAKEKPGLLDRIGWTKEDARRFLDRWDAMLRSASGKGPEAEESRKRLNEALRSLGLRPRGVELRHGALTPDQPENLRESAKQPPPPEWADQLREYTRGISGGDARKDR